MKKILIGLFLFFASFLILVGAKAAKAQDENSASKLGITFPIAGLGNCKSVSECRDFCEDPVNQETCISFAKEKGFYHEENVQNTAVLQKAQSQLGCNSYESCRSTCEAPENYQKCHSFASNNNLTGGYVRNPEEGKTLETAKTVLGCNSYQECNSFCQNPANAQKCTEMARLAGLRGGQEMKGPGGCTSSETCRTFCEDPGNFEVCKRFAEGTGRGSFEGTKKCDSPESCRSYCENNPGECRSFGSGNYNPQEACSKTPSCAWIDSTCRCGFTGVSVQDAKKQAEDYGKYCRENPTKCMAPSEDPQDYQKQRQEFADYCRDNPQKCRSSGDPAAECAKYSGCNWNGNWCQCSGTSTNYRYEDPETACKRGGGCSWTDGRCNCPANNTQSGTPNPAFTPYPGQSGQYVSPEAGCKQGGCTWTGTYCNCSGSSSGGTYPRATPYYSSNDPAKECTSHSGCSWTGSWCNCSGTSGSGTGNYVPPSGNDPATMCAKTSGCSWNGSWCQCSSGGGGGGSTPAPAPAPMTQAQPAPQPAPMEPQPAPATQPAPAPTQPVVQGIKIVRSFFEALLDFLK